MMDRCQYAPAIKSIATKKRRSAVPRSGFLDGVAIGRLIEDETVGFGMTVKVEILGSWSRQAKSAQKNVRWTR